MARKIVSAFFLRGSYTVACDDGALWILSEDGNWRQLAGGPPSEHEVKSGRLKDLEAAHVEAKRITEAAVEAEKRLREQIDAARGEAGR